MKSTLLFFLLFIGICPSVASAGHPQTLPFTCHITPEIPSFFPEEKELGSTNNLWRKPGAAVPASGYPIYISGTVLDERCIPVEGAKIRIWQADTAGNYNLSKHDARAIDEYFTSSGITLSDNEGKFHFITIFPGTNTPHEAPHIKFYITHDQLGLLQTRMYFPNQSTNAQDEEYRLLSTEEQNLLTAEPVKDSKASYIYRYFFNITLSGMLPYKSF